MKSLRHALLALLLVALVSCSQSSSSSVPNNQPRTLSQRMNEKTGFVQDEEGNWKPRVDRRSDFESKGESPYFKGEYAKKEYKANDYTKTSFWGKKTYDRTAYQGDTDGSRFQTTSRFNGTTARDAGQTARENGGNFATGTYQTSSAREAGKREISRPSDAETDIRRRVFTPPVIVDWETQRNLSIQQTKGFLGRD